MAAKTLAAIMSSVAMVAAQQLNSVDDLAAQYGVIFKTGNRNAASHLWTSYILNRSASMPKEALSTVFRGYCPISGSPLPDVPHTQYRVSMPRVNGGSITGISHHCCWPCICDMQESVRVDTKTITTADGPEEYNVLVIGDPCSKPEELSKTFVDPFSGVSQPLNSPNAAPEVICGANGKLVGAIYSDSGYPIIGLFFTDQASLDRGFTEATTFDSKCQERKQAGYNSGMGLIFHLVADISPIPVTEHPSGLYEVTPKMMSSRSQSVRVALVALAFVSLSVGGAVVFKLGRHRSLQSPSKESDSEVSMEDIAA